MSDYTSADITEMCDTWLNYSGFTGETCVQCRDTVNMLIGGAGWICKKCGWWNNQSFSNIPHEHPDFGPARDVIVAGHNASKKWAELLK